jgi:hypothetical protein
MRSEHQAGRNYAPAGQTHYKKNRTKFFLEYDFCNKQQRAFTIFDNRRQVQQRSILTVFTTDDKIQQAKNIFCNRWSSCTQNKEAKRMVDRK